MSLQDRILGQSGIKRPPLPNSWTVAVQSRKGCPGGRNPGGCEYFTGTKWCPRLASRNWERRAPAGNRGSQEACAEDTHASPRPASQLGSGLPVPPWGSGSAAGTALSSGNASELERALRTAVAPTADASVRQPGHQLPVLPVPTRRPEADPPYLPARRHSRPPPRAAPARPRAAAPPAAPWRRLPRLDPGPGAGTGRGRCLRGGPGGRRL